jgi:hypothetical protein
LNAGLVLYGGTMKTGIIEGKNEFSYDLRKPIYEKKVKWKMLAQYKESHQKEKSRAEKLRRFLETSVTIPPIFN